MCQVEVRSLRDINFGVDYDAGNTLDTKITEPRVQTRLCLAEAEGFEPPWACTQTVFKFYFLFVVFRLLLLFSSPNCRKISVLTALLFDNSGFLLCFGIVSHSLALLIFSAFLTAFCRGFVDCFAWIKKFICCFILFLFPTNTRHGAKQIFAYQSNQESV